MDVLYSVLCTSKVNLPCGSCMSFNYSHVDLVVVGESVLFPADEVDVKWILFP